jgi:nitrite reductase/ring-hydroxylating ferredoxin subunit/uncharacterized membrane protein
VRSKASFKGHPIHPALIPFPFAFLTGALLFDAAAMLAERPSWWTTGGHLAGAGIITALIAGIPGVVDYLYTVPPNSTGKQRATRHMIVNLSAVALFAGAWLLRHDAGTRSEATVIAIEVVAVALLSAGGWMGGTLVNRNQIGVDHRYASAGKWQEQELEESAGTPVVVAKVEDLQVDQMKLLRLDGRRIVLARTAGGYVAFDDRCTHSGGALSGGVMMCGTVQCPWHGSQFDVRTGEVKAGPAKQRIATYQVEEKQGEVRLIL